MKRFYQPLLTALSLACLAAAPAAAGERMSLTKLTPQPALLQCQAAPLRHAAGSGSEIDGTYYMALGDYYFQGSVGQTTIQVNLTVDGDSLYITDPTQEWLPTPVRALFNSETGVASFEPYVLFDKDSQVDMFVPTKYDTVVDDITFRSFEAVYDKATTSFTIPADCGFAWPAWKGANAMKDALALKMSTVAGWYALYDIEMLETNRDYVLSATTDYVCPAGESITVNLEVGTDIGKIYCIAVGGKYDASEGANGQAVIKLGKEVDNRSELTLETPDENGLYSIMFAGTNAAGRLVATATTYQVVNIENDADWQPVPDTKTVFTEGLVSDLFGISAEDIEVELQQHIATPGRFRFAAPYDKHSKAQGFTFVDQTDYIYVNATDNLRVYVEASGLGVTVGEYGAPYVFSWPALTAGTPDFNKENPNDFGRYINGVIKVPTVTSFNNEPYNFDAPSTLTLTLTKDSSIKEISAGAADKTVYDIQGRRVANPTRGLYIVNGRKTLAK